VEPVFVKDVLARFESHARQRPPAPPPPQPDAEEEGMDLDKDGDEDEAADAAEEDVEGTEIMDEGRGDDPLPPRSVFDLEMENMDRTVDDYLDTVPDEVRHWLPSHPDAFRALCHAMTATSVAFTRVSADPQLAHKTNQSRQAAIGEAYRRMVLSPPPLPVPRK